MICSMTGYGTATGTSGKLSVTVEIKSVNNRFLDASVRLPRLYSFAEDAVKGLVQKRLIRGKVDIFINIDASRDDSRGEKLGLDPTFDPVALGIKNADFWQKKQEAA